MIACYRNDDVIDIFLDLGSRDADFLFLGKGQNAYALNMRKEVQLYSQNKLRGRGGQHDNRLLLT